MLFNSYIFLFEFLPVTVAGFYLIGNAGHHRIAITWLVGASLLYYGWWNPAYTSLIIGSILVNYAFGISLAAVGELRSRNWLLAAGVAANLALLGYYKYANFFIDNVNHVAGTDFHLGKIILPLAISFFTFQQIAYLVDSYKGLTKEYNFLHYCLFVTFFPQLIAGPIVHHGEMMPQFARDALYRFRADKLAVGLTIFVIGLFKKVVLADGIATWSTFFFDAADSGHILSFTEAWVAALSYTLQLYFDFSGYSDMAIGIARMFGIRLPLNFNSPYKATSIIDFWRRWHMTLSRFLRDYVYIPLGGNRHGETRRYANIMITMLLGGLWHGAGWNFVIWGGLHGVFLIINHVWRKFFGEIESVPVRAYYWSLTFLAVVVTWVPFRAETLEGTKAIFAGMLGMHGITAFHGTIEPLGGLITWLGGHGVEFTGLFQYLTLSSFWACVWIAVLVLVLLALPNTQQFMRDYRPAFEINRGEIGEPVLRGLVWRPTAGYALITGGVIVGIAINYLLATTRSMSEFLYFNF